MSFAFVLQRIRTTNPSFYSVLIKERLCVAAVTNKPQTSQQKLLLFFPSHEKSTGDLGKLPGELSYIYYQQFRLLQSCGTTISTLVSIITVAAEKICISCRVLALRSFLLTFHYSKQVTWSHIHLKGMRKCNHPICLEGEKEWKPG